MHSKPETILKSLCSPVHPYNCKCADTTTEMCSVTLSFIDDAGDAVAEVEIGHEFMTFSKSAITGESYCLHLLSGHTPGISDDKGILIVPENMLFGADQENKRDDDLVQTEIIAVCKGIMELGAFFTLTVEDMGATVEIPMQRLCRVHGKVTSAHVCDARELFRSGLRQYIRSNQPQCASTIVTRKREDHETKARKTVRPPCVSDL